MQTRVVFSENRFAIVFCHVLSMSSKHEFDRFVFDRFRTMILKGNRGNDSGADHAILQKSARRITETRSSEHNLPSTFMSCDSIFCLSHDIVCVCVCVKQ